MKRFNLALCILLALTLAVSGCCSFTAADGTVTKSFANCFKIAQTQVCNADPAAIATADAVLAILKPIAGTLIPGSSAYLALITAQGIKDTGCATLTALNSLIAFLDGFNTAKTLAAVQLKKGAAVAIDPTPLVNWRDRSKK